MNKRNRRYPILTDDGNHAVSEMSPEESKQLADNINEIDEAVSEAAKENEKELNDVLRKLASIMKPLNQPRQEQANS